MEIEIVEIPKIELRWSNWYPWNNIFEDARSGGIKIPNKIAGVYQVRYIDSEEMLHIGRANDLRMRIRQGLVKGKSPHSAGESIREKEDESRLVVRWAITDRPCAAEEDLHRKYVDRYGKWPLYTDHT